MFVGKSVCILGVLSTYFVLASVCFSELMKKQLLTLSEELVLYLAIQQYVVLYSLLKYLF